MLIFLLFGTLLPQKGENSWGLGCKHYVFQKDNFLPFLFFLKVENFFEEKKEKIGFFGVKKFTK